MRRLALVLLLGAGSVANAQVVIRGGRSSLAPKAWIGLSAGLVQAATVNDGSTNSQWDFGSATSYRASYESVVQPGVTLGMAGSYASTPLRYTGGATTTASTSCPAGCDAKATVMQLLGIVHAGGDGMGFHQVFEGTGGVTVYTNFKTQEGGQLLEPIHTDKDLSFSLGYGFGFGVTPTSSIEIVQEFGLSIHQKTGLAANSNNVPRSSTTRISWRIGIGGGR
jgi:hypothetical protein